MKHLFFVSIFTVLTLFISPLSTKTTALASQPAFEVESDTVPGSIIRFEHLTIEDGLSQNAGLAIFQDSKGYLWIGTQDGLNRYDGYTFKIYKHDSDDPASISHNSILAIEEDKDGYLWIGTWGGGLNRFDPAAETFIPYHFDPREPASATIQSLPSRRTQAASCGWGPWEVWTATIL